MTPQVAAARLASELGGTAERWRAWLDVQARRGALGDVHPEPGRGVRRWPAAAIDAYIARQRGTPAPDAPSSRIAEVTRAFGLDEPGTMDGYGRRADMSTMGLLTEAHEPFVRLLTSRPLVAWRLTLAQARELMAELGVAIDDAERLAAVAARAQREEAGSDR